MISVALLAACSLYTPEYVGTWIDEESFMGWTYVLEFGRHGFRLTMERYDYATKTTDRYATLGIMKAGAGVMEATITGQELLGTELEDSELQAFIAYIGGGVYTAQYEISGSRMTLSGKLVEKLFYPLTSVKGTKL